MRLEMTHDLGINLLGTKANKHWWFNQKWGSTQPINGHLTNHNGILGKSWKQGMFMGYIILYRQSFHICLRVSNSGMPRKWGKINWDDASSSFFFFPFFLSNHDNKPSLPLPTAGDPESREPPQGGSRGQSQHITQGMAGENTWKCNMSCNPARTIWLSSIV